MYAKLTYLLTCIAFLVSSCATDDMIPPKGAEMLFTVSDLSRGSVTSSIDHFVVYGDVKPATSESSAPVALFSNTKVEYVDGSWQYDGTQYWMPGCEHSFVAVYPQSVFGAGNTPHYSNSLLSFEYAIPAPDGILSSNSDVADILVATHRRYYEGGNESADRISLSFSHILSLINIAPAFIDNGMSSDDYILVHQLELTGIKTKAKFNIRPAARLTGSQTDDMSVDVSALDEGNLAIAFRRPVKIGNYAENVSLFADDDALIMLPQDMAADSNATLRLTYTTNEDQSKQTVSIPLSDQKWVSGNRYLYKFTIERTGVIFGNCEINPWNVVTGEEITVD